MRFLVFRLYGPMASWGDVAVGEVRPSGLHPGRSAILGLLAAALGIRRDDEDTHRALGEDFSIAVQVDNAGVPLMDYHTVQVARKRKGQIKTTRADELRGPRHSLATLVSRRDYRCDALYRIVVWNRTGGRSLEELAGVLERPTFPLYLGRKACPPALPLCPRVVEAATVVEALSNADLPVPDQLGSSRGTGRGLYWDGRDDLDGLVGLKAQEFHQRRDDPDSRIRWSFRNRREFFAPISEENADALSEPTDA